MAAGIDIEGACRHPFEYNNGATFYKEDVNEIDGVRLKSLFPSVGAKILVGCAPCQPFSTYNQRNADPQWSLVDKFAELIVDTNPDVISMENVPRLLEFEGGDLFRRFVRKLEANGYSITPQIVFLPDYGLAQRRTRLVVLGSRYGAIFLEEPQHDGNSYRTVEDEIGELPPLQAGEADPQDPLHCTSAVSELNAKRLRASKPGGTWRDWDSELIAECHRHHTGKGYGAVYGRMEWGAPSPTITTQFYGFGNGRFGHPTQDRALSLREGALLQSFPSNYEFIAPGERINMRRLGRLIGNAVPVTLGRVIARSIRRHLDQNFP